MSRSTSKSGRGLATHSVLSNSNNYIDEDVCTRQRRRQHKDSLLSIHATDDDTRDCSAVLLAAAHSESDVRDRKRNDSSLDVSGSNSSGSTSELSVSSTAVSPRRHHSDSDRCPTPIRHCSTPSTIAYTHSSAMEDSDIDDATDSDTGLERRGFVDGGVGGDDRKQSNQEQLDGSGASCSDGDSDLGSDMSTPGVPFSPPSSLSDLSDDCGDWNDRDQPSASGEEITSTAAAVTLLTNRLSKILRRVEELDLLNLAATTSVEPKRSRRGKQGDSDSDGNAEPGECIPDAVRLTRRELIALYSECVQLRLGGSMYSIPTGRLVRFLTLLLVNMQIGARVTPAPLNPVSLNEFCVHIGQFGVGSFMIIPHVRLHLTIAGQFATMQCDDIFVSSLLVLLIQADVIDLLGKRQHQKGDDRHATRFLAAHLSESVLWASPGWAQVLTGLDCARIALIIVTGPDMPRPLLMEDLIDSIVVIARRQLTDVLCKVVQS